MKKVKVAIVILYFISYVLPTYVGAPYFGWTYLVFGWTNFFDSNFLFGLSWSSNLFLLVGIYSKYKKFTKVIIFGASILFALPALWVTNVPNFYGPVYDVKIGFGMIIWMSSYFSLFLFSLFDLIKTKDK